MFPKTPPPLPVDPLLPDELLPDELLLPDGLLLGDPPMIVTMVMPFMLDEVWPELALTQPAQFNTGRVSAPAVTRSICASLNRSFAAATPKQSGSAARPINHAFTDPSKVQVLQEG